MNILEAIKILIHWKEVSESEDSYLLDESVRLGIEALKRLRLTRIQRVVYPEDPLPGETEE